MARPLRSASVASASSWVLSARAVALVPSTVQGTGKPEHFATACPGIDRGRPSLLFLILTNSFGLARAPHAGDCAAWDATGLAGRQAIGPRLLRKSFGPGVKRAGNRGASRGQSAQAVGAARRTHGRATPRRGLYRVRKSQLAILGRQFWRPSKCRTGRCPSNGGPFRG